MTLLKLNVDCIRAVMLCLEENLKFIDKNGELAKCYLSLEQLCGFLPQYSKADIFYSLSNLDQAGYISVSIRWSGNAVYSCTINHITYAGHEFLDGIRDSSRWSKIKGVAASVRNYSLSAISAIAEGVTSAAISCYLAKN